MKPSCKRGSRVGATDDERIGYRPNDPGAGPGLGPLAGGTDFGPQDILVRAVDEARAREVLASREAI